MLSYVASYSHTGSDNLASCAMSDGLRAFITFESSSKFRIFCKILRIYKAALWKIILFGPVSSIRDVELIEVVMQEA